MAYLKLLKLHLKSAFKSLPLIIAGTFGFLVLVVAVAAGCGYLLKDDAKQEKMNIIVLMSDADNDENWYVEQAFLYLDEIPEVNDVCAFSVEHNRDAAYERLRDNKASAIVYIPDNFISGIMNGSNIPAQIIFPKSGLNNTSIMFREMLEASATDLSTAQAGIYAVDDVCKVLGQTAEAVSTSENFLNMKYLGVIMGRISYLEERDVSKGAGLSIIQFYVCTVIVTLMMFGGISCVGLLKSDNHALTSALRRKGIVNGVLNGMKVVSATLVFTMIYTFAYIGIAIAANNSSIVESVFSANGAAHMITGWLGMTAMLFSIMSLASLIYKIGDSTVTGALMLFIATIVMMFMSGCIIPATMLPVGIMKIGRWLVTSTYFDMCAQIVRGSVSMLTVVVCLGYGLLFLILSGLIERCQKS